MPITHKTLAERLKQARETVGISQARVAVALGLSRPTISQIESGERKVNSIELAKLAHLYGRSMSEFLAADFDPGSVLRALFRARLDQELQPIMLEAASHCLEIGRETHNLEKILGISNRPGPPLLGQAVAPADSRAESFEQAEEAACAERARLGLGIAPLPDLVDLFESQGVRVALLDLPDQVEGLSLFPPDLGPYIVVNCNRASHARRRFSFAYEYAHVLFDSHEQSQISLRGERDDPREFRANAFAAAFLMPADGIRRQLSSIGKRQEQISFRVSEGGLASVQGHDEWNAVQPTDVAQLAHHFGVSHQALIYRLNDLGFLSPEVYAALERARKDNSLFELHGILFGKATDAGADAPGAFRHRFLGLVLEALRRDEISWGKGRELGRLIGMEDDEFQTLCDRAGLEPDIIDFMLPSDMVG
jgi:Zn-dependent peptidase ImmA (M78 family)/DNA-binding XRE family transcriptional regulator